MPAQVSDTNLDQCFPYLENDSLYRTAVPVAVGEIAWSGPCLVIHPDQGFCNNNAYRLVFSSVVRKSYPVQLHAVLIKVADDPCDKPNSLGLAYNLTQLKQKWKKAVIMLQGYDKPIVVE